MSVRKTEAAPAEAEIEARKSETPDLPKGLHLSAERLVRVDDYPERPYKEAVTKEHKASLVEAGLW